METAFKPIRLIKRSTGQRGRLGQHKGYSITVHEERVYLRWGKSELSQVYWQEQKHTFASSVEAVEFAWRKYYEKIDKGYVDIQE